MSDKKENRGGRRKGAGRKPMPKTTRKVAFDIDLGDYFWMKARAKSQKMTLAATIRHAIRIYRDGS